MKILKVRSLNINSLKGAFEIDFEAFLQGESLFAITGATGAGKSTILDIITCAMYGRTPRLSNPNDLMSRYTGECYCEVEFEVKKQLYRSSWSQKRARKKADGTFQTAKMEIVDLQTKKIIESKLREVPKVIEEISGLDFDRFVQSMMLAQGSFDAFLKAKENERSTLLEKITGTSIYKEISQEIYETFTQKKKEIEGEEIALGSIELLAKELLEEKTKSLEGAKEQKLALDKKQNELKTISLWLENRQKLENDNTKYIQDYEQIAKEKEDKKEDFQRLERASSALRVQALFLEKNALTKTIEEQMQTLLALQKEREKTQAQCTQKAQELATTQDLVAKEKSSFEQNTQKIKARRVLQTQEESKCASKQEREKKLQIRKQELALLLGDEDPIEQNIAKQTQEIISLEQELQEVIGALKKIEEKTTDLTIQETQTRVSLQKLEELLNALDAHTKLQEALQKENLQEDTYKKEKEIQTKLKNGQEKLLEQIQENLQTLQETREKELLIKNYEADRLQLKNGQECFLCGAKEHPYADHAPVLDLDKTAAKIKEQEDLLRQEQKQQQQNENTITKLDVKLEGSALEREKLQKALADIQKTFEKHSFVVQRDAKLDLQEERAQKEKDLEGLIALRERKEKLLEVKERGQSALAQKQQIQLQTTNILNALLELESENKELEREIQALQTQSKTLLDVADLDAFEKKITQGFEDLQAKYNSLQNSVTELRSKEGSYAQQIEKLTQKQTQDKTRLESLKEGFENVLQEYGFGSALEFEQALLSKEAFETLQTSCRALEERYTQIQTLKTNTAQKLKEQRELKLSERDLQSVNEELRELQSSIDELQKSIGSVEKELEINAANSKKHEEKIKELEKKKDALRVWVKLNDMIGSANGEKFAKFAQGITLDQLIYLANKHLELLSPRYELQRGLDSSKQLEIEIIDGFQGDAIRGVNTLSGGESFIVSLSLALGLSSLASQKISIDSLFLDEGFGTLDNDSLELALSALSALQSSGKMVGVISHVEALKERIPLQIKVESRGDGTSVLSMP